MSTWYQAKRQEDGSYLYRGYHIERFRPAPGSGQYPWIITEPDGRLYDVPTLKDAKWHVDCSIEEFSPVQRFRSGQRVQHSTSSGGFPATQLVTIVEDNGGPRVKIRWFTKEGPKVGRHVVAYHGHRVEHWTDRERLSP